MKITLPDLSLVVLIGASGSGKSTFARKHFLPTEVLSSDFCRGLVSDDENDQAATTDAFDVLHFVAAKRLAAGKLTVVDATNVQPEARRPLVELARRYHCLPVAIVLDMPERECQDRNQARPDRAFGPHVVRNHIKNLRQSLRGLEREGFRHVFVLRSLEDVDSAELTREPLYNNKKDETGPFDIIGDIHGCFDELVTLLGTLGYDVQPTGDSWIVTPPEGRRALFVGDLCDRGPKSPCVLKLVMGMCAAGTARCVPGNHDIKLLRKLNGKNVQITHGLGETLAQLEGETSEFIASVRAFLDSLVSHYVFDGGKLVVAHAGMKAEMQGRGSGKVREFALFGETTGETDEFGLPVRIIWANEYRGTAMVVYGHTPVPTAEWLNNTINIDTGCVFGGALTALRYPEREIVSVPALQTYAEPARPFLPDPDAPITDALSSQQAHDDILDIDDVIGKRLIETRLHGKVTIREENAIAALEVMSRFAADPKWLIYLPPTMSPPETTSEPGLLEHPNEAFAYFRRNDVATVVCEEKHMGSRTVVVVCRDESVARARFAVQGGGAGICVTRTGRRFFDDLATEAALIDIVRAAMTSSGLWDELETDWVCLDCELMPWSAKARELLIKQYASVGCAAQGALGASVEALAMAAIRTDTAAPLLEATTARLEMASMFTTAYGRYCWTVNGLEDLRLAPFHILATEGRTYTDKDHVWHMTTLARLCACSDGVLFATPYKVLDLTDESGAQEGVDWWTELTGRGGEGMVVKPLNFTARGPKGLVQPAVKCRGREYLRIIYGPEYTLPQYLNRLRSRSVAGKRSLALREFALGIEGLERFVRREPLRRVHECVFGVLALESEPVDPRL
ncbi:MAG TPA: polynucleotide kinase-phosphatase [Capsulimonadaceae bacterium]|jgi:polynucleotide kinase-phosphatase